MAKRREVIFENPNNSHAGVSLTVTRGGVEVSGWYDSICGMDGVYVPWDKLDEARKDVFARKPKGDAPTVAEFVIPDFSRSQAEQKLRALGPLTERGR
jgi:hypothetical protein